jgi:hypothetical protein
MIICVIIPLLGCAATTGRSITPDEANAIMETEVPKGKSIIYIFRKPRFVGAAANNQVNVDGIDVAVLSNGTFVYGIVNPGRNKIVIGSRDSGGSSQGYNKYPYTIHTKPNQKYYYNLVEHIQGNSFSITDVSDAMASIKICKLTNRFDLSTDTAIAKQIQDVAVKSQDYRQEVQLPPTITNIPHGKSWAVIVGISEYQYSGDNGLNNLIYADDDARAFARVLRKLGWSKSHIKLLVNEEATQRNIMIALESWLTKASTNDQVILFWAGHGFPDPEDPEKVYFACYDTDISIPATGYRMDRVRAALEERRCRNVVLLADTCHAGKLITRGDRGLSIVPHIDKMRREKKVPKGWIFMVGADTDRQAIEHTSWTNGAFTHSLVKGLTGGADGYESVAPKDGVVTMGELRAYLSSAMPDETQRILGVAKRPVITTSTGDPDIWNLTLQAK